MFTDNDVHSAFYNSLVKKQLKALLEIKNISEEKN